MRQIQALFLVFFVPVFVSIADAARGPDPESIFIQQTKGFYEVTVPASRIVAIIPRGDLVLGSNPTGAVENPRYFYFEDEAQQLIISGWFEPGQGFPGLKEFWESETTKWREGGLPAPQSVSFAKFSDWEAVIYDMPLPAGSNSHIRAHWLQAGTWIDLHLSITSERTPADNRRTLKSILKTIQVRQKE